MTRPERIVLYGAGNGGKYAITGLRSETAVVGVADGDVRKQGTYFCGHEVFAPERIPELQFDKVLVATVRFDEVCERLCRLGIDRSRIEQGITAPTAGEHEAVTAEAWLYHPKVSIVMPAYNRAAVVGRAIRSVLGQSYAHWELIVVDDGSADTTLGEVEAACGSESRTRILCGPHRGVSAARNAGLETAGGDIVAYLDSDNRWHCEYLRYMVARFANGRYDCGYAGMNLIDEAKGTFRPWIPGFDRAHLEQMNFIDLNVFMHRRSLIGAYGAFDEGLARHVDWDLILRFTRGGPPFILRAVLADYYVSGASARISETVSFAENYEKLSQRHRLNGEPSS